MKKEDNKIIHMLIVFSVILILVMITLILIQVVSANRIYIDEEHREYGRWAMNTLNNEAGFNSVRWSYTISDQQEPRQGDLIIEFKPINGYGWGFNGKILINSLTNGYEPNQRFLLLHEAYHSLTNQGHSNDGSIMDIYGGDVQFRDYQIKILKEELLK